MVLDHVAQAAALLVIAGARFDPDLFGDGDLDVVDEIAVPDRLEDGVGEALHEQVLYGLLAEVVVDAENLRFVEHARQLLVQGLGAGEVATERFFDDALRLVALPEVARGQAAGAEVLDDRGEHVGGVENVEQALQLLADFLLEAADALAEPVEGGLLVVTAADVQRAWREAAPDFGAGLAT